jgi:hypothetical protein
MQTKPNAKPSSPDDDWLHRYEAEVSQIVLRRVIQALFIARAPVKLVDLLATANASINSVADAFQTLKSYGFADYVDGRIALTTRGRRLIFKERRRFFFPRMSVHYRPSATERTSRRAKADRFVDGRLPDSYRLGRIDKGKTDA